MQVWHRISEQLVVHVARRKYPLNHPRYGMNVAPVRARFLAGQACKVCDVAVSKDDDHVAASDGVPLKVCVANASHIKGSTEVRPVQTEPAIHHASFPGVPVLRPCSCHWLAFAERRSAFIVSLGRTVVLLRDQDVLSAAQPNYRGVALTGLRPDA